MWQSVEVRFAGDHPAARGHFPSNPIIPGALLLDEILKAVGDATAREGETRIHVAKFFRPVRPGERLVVRWRPVREATIAFECRLALGDSLAVAGTLEIGRTRP